jgi:tetratricopeptide (TPR) repeat protein
MTKKGRNARKEQLPEQDQLTLLLSQISQFVAQNKQKVYGSLAVIVMVGVVVWGIHYFERLAQDKAYALFEQGLTTYLNSESEEKTKSTDEIRINDFDKVLKKYPKTDAARLTSLTYGDYHYKKGSYDRAIELYMQALKASHEYPLMQAFILNSIGCCYEEKKDYKAASEYFLKIIDLEDRLLKDTAHFNLGRIYETMGDMPSALMHYKKVIEDYPESIHFQSAKNRRSRLESASQPS